MSTTLFLVFGGGNYETSTIRRARRPDGTRAIAPTDNTTASARIRKGTSHIAEERTLLFDLAVQCIVHGQSVRAPHVPGSHIIVAGADAVSREALAHADAMPKPGWDVARLHEEVERLRLTPGRSTSAYAAALRTALDFQRTALYWCRHRGDIPGGHEAAPSTLSAYEAGRAAGAPTAFGVAVAVTPGTAGAPTSIICSAYRPTTFAREDPTAAPLPPHLLSITAACDARGKEASTTQAHGTAIRRFVRVMHAEGVRNATEQLPSHAAGPGAPAASTSLASIVGFIAAASQPSADGTFPFAAKTIADTVSALRSFHLSCGVAPAFPAKHPRIAAVLAGAKKLQRGHDSSRRGAAFAVTPDHLRIILLVCIQRRQAALARNRVDLAYGASRDALFYALAYVACLRKSEAIRMKRRHLRPSTTHADAWDIHIPYTKNNQDGQQLLQDLTIAGKPAYGVNLHEIIVTHLALMDARGLDGSAPLFGDIRDPTRQLAEKGSTMMDRLHKSSPQHEAYYSVLERLTGDTSHRELGIRFGPSAFGDCYTGERGEVDQWRLENRLLAG
ncbi:hypothetical protein PPROV_000220500 [Pycnococcus provasolii]|uniref:Uncharacterized protein n=1 Tax=Pycnococcus provasolii TaxID=41880 RepID=A0A830HC16_9CHLO|nr:hypothetical protein PPROV_000220500 [Pycnococcus provasolii]